MDLSIHVRRMKFMQRGQSAETNQALQETSGKAVSDEQWQLDLPALRGKRSKYDAIDSHVELCDLRYGRMSFQGFNKTTEKMMKVWNNEEEAEDEKSEKEDSAGSISDEEMAERFTTLVGTVAKKYKKKRQKSTGEKDPSFKNKRRKKDPENFFIKPDEDS